MRIANLRAVGALMLASVSIHCANVQTVEGGGGMGGTAGSGGMAGTGGAGGAGGSAQPACGSPSSDFAVCGFIRGEAPPDGSRVLLVWTVEPDGYKFGEGTTSGDRYVVEFKSAPPAEALFEGTLGIGIVLVVPSDMGDVPDGPLEQGFDPLIESWIALGVLDAIIYRTGDSLVEWDLAFPPNDYGCGRCVVMEEGFDEFEPVDCEEGLDLEGSSDPADLMYMCNFT